MQKKNISPFHHEITRDGEVYSDIYTRMAKENVIFLSEDLTSETAGVIVSRLFLMDQQENRDIELWINTSGGEVEAFFAIYDMMQIIKNDVQTVCIGKAYSAGALLLSAGTKGKRFMTPSSQAMIHQVQVDDLPGGTGTVVLNEAKEIERINKKLIDVLSRHSGQFSSKVKKDIEHDLYLDAEAAVAYGLVDKIFPFFKPVPELKHRKTKKTEEVMPEKAEKSE